ncbi:MAG: arylesterase [Betaproteobacteria bacterium]|nr:arylesterase [Betaproteobacteria bacterium]
MLVRFLIALFLTLPQMAAAATILVFGDSLSAGYGLPLEQGWVSLLERRLRDERPDYKIANASISGETTGGGRNRIEAALEAHRPAIVILALGANDGLRGQNLETMRANLEAMIESCRRFKTKVLLIGMRLPPNYGAPYTEKFHRVFAGIARERKLPLVPFMLDGFAENHEYFQADGIHPTARAQPLIAETVWKALRPLLKRE